MKTVSNFGVGAPNMWHKQFCCNNVDFFLNGGIYNQYL